MKKTKFCEVPVGVILAVFLFAVLLIFLSHPMNVQAADMKPIGTFTITFYCPCHQCSGDYGHQTSSGAYATEGRTVAVDTKVIPYGTKLYIDGYGEFVAEDTGGKWVKGKHIDIFLESHLKCLDSKHGKVKREVYVIE